MTFRSNNSTAAPTAESYISQLRPRRARRAARRAGPNYAGRSTAATLRKQALLLSWLREGATGWTVSELAFLTGMSRQLCLYHVKKLAATGQAHLEFEPCEANGGLRLRVWDRVRRATALAEEVFGVAA